MHFIALDALAKAGRCRAVTSREVTLRMADMYWTGSQFPWHWIANGRLS